MGVRWRKCVASSEDLTQQKTPQDYARDRMMCMRRLIRASKQRSDGATATRISFLGGNCGEAS